jgi:hypothetical protein
MMPDDVDKRARWDCRPIEGSQSIHFVFYISNTDVTLLNTRELACFYVEYMDDNHAFYEEKPRVNHRA